ncbi:hypothetical protein HC928_22205, partial [bacterium]|nr:hypothetical protein [bacterium]
KTRSRRWRRCYRVAAPEQTTTYLYGMERLAGVGPTGTDWYLHDGLGSVRLTLDDAGVPVDPSGYSYTPFGVPQSGAIAEPFGFTGEQWDAATGLDFSLFTSCGGVYCLSSDLDYW